MQILGVKGDGLCFFRSVAQGISHVDHGLRLSETEETDRARLLREACNAFLYDHPGLIVYSQEYLEDPSHFTNNGRKKIDMIPGGFNAGRRRANALPNIIRAANSRIRQTQWQRGSQVQWADELDASILSFILSREIKIFNRRGYSSTVTPVFPIHFTNTPIAVFHTPEIHYDAYVRSTHPSTPAVVPKLKKRKMMNDVTRTAFAETANGNVMELGRVLNGGVNPDATNAEGLTLLMVAAASGSAGCLKLLIKYGAKLDVRHKPTGNTALILAVKNHCMSCVKLLVDAHANPRIKNANGRNALTIATAHQNAHIMDYITEKVRLYGKKKK